MLLYVGHCRKCSRLARALLPNRYYAANLYSASASAVALKPPSNLSDALEQDVIAQKKRRARKSAEVLTLDDLLSMRPHPFTSLKPPRVLRRKSNALKLEWYTQQFDKAVSTVENAFTLKQLKKLESELGRLSSVERGAIPRGKLSLAKHLVTHRKGWDWPAPTVLKEKADLRESTTPDAEGGQTSAESRLIFLIHCQLMDPMVDIITSTALTMSTKEAYLILQSVQGAASNHGVRIDASPPEAASTSTSVQVQLYGPAQAVADVLKIIRNAKKSLTSVDFETPQDVELSIELIQNIALESSTYIEQSKTDKKLLQIWRKTESHGQAAFTLLNAAIATARQERHRQYYGSITASTDSKYHLFPTVLKTNPSVATTLPGAAGLFARVGKVSSELDRRGLPSGSHQKLLPLSADKAPDSLSTALLHPLLDDAGALRLSAVFGQFIFPLPSLSAESIKPTADFSELVSQLMLRSRPSFIPDLPPSFLPYLHQTPRSVADIDQSRTEAIAQRMSKYMFDGSNARKLIYAPVDTHGGLPVSIEATLSMSPNEETSIKFEKTNRSQAGLFLPEADCDVLLSAEKRLHLPELHSTLPNLHFSSKTPPKTLNYADQTYRLVNDAHCRTSVIHLGPTLALPSLVHLKGAEWLMEKSYSQPPVKEQTSKLELRIDEAQDDVQVLDSLISIARIL